jgi:shikimate dehydrogenase
MSPADAPGAGFLVGLIGSGIRESFTPALHEAEARHLGLRYTYRILDLDVGPARGAGIGQLVSAARLLGFDGLNITHPMKQAVLPELDVLSPEAREIGAVNSVLLGRDATVGHNTDASGFAELARRALTDERMDTVVQLGAGGAGAAVAHALLSGRVDSLCIVDADEAVAVALAGRLASRFGADRVRAAGPTGLRERVRAADGFVNATPMGMASSPGNPLGPDAITDRHWVVDIVYLPLETQLMRDAAAHGARVTGGSDMTVFQAARAFELFTGFAPDVGRMLRHMSELVAERSGHRAVVR